MNQTPPSLWNEWKADFEKFMLSNPDSEVEPRDDDLLPCPFCGGKAKRVTAYCGHNDSTNQIKCTQCPGMMELYSGDIAEAWNKRKNS
jgi:hypothetical protein